MKVKGYDVNVYVADGMARLSAYEYTYSDAPEPEPNGTNTSRFTTLSLPLEPMFDTELSYLIGVDWNKQSASGLEDYDSPWESVEWLNVAETPLMIRAWADGLPEYEPEIQHEWDTAGLAGMERGTVRIVHCLNCDTTYEQKRLSWQEQSELVG